MPAASVPTRSPVEARVLGVLAEKHRTVSDTYPLMLNAALMLRGPQTIGELCINYDLLLLPKVMPRTARGGELLLCSGAGSRLPRNYPLLSAWIAVFSMGEEASMHRLPKRGLGAVVKKGTVLDSPLFYGA